MKFIELLKANIRPALNIKESFNFTTLDGNTFNITYGKDGKFYKNICDEITSVNIDVNYTTAIGKSTAKKIGGAVVGGAALGGIGAIAGALAVGNNKTMNVPSTMTVSYVEVIDGIEVKNVHELKVNIPKRNRVMELIKGDII